MPVDHYAKEVDYYGSAEELLTETDIVETDVHIPGWRKKFRIRALTFGQQEAINAASTDKDTGQLNHEEWVYHTIANGVVRPKFTLAQAKKLSELNGHFVGMLADEIWNIGRISKTAFDMYIQKLTELNELEKAEKEKVRK